MDFVSALKVWNKINEQRGAYLETLRTGTVGSVLTEEDTLDHVHNRWMNAEQPLIRSTDQKIWNGFWTRAEQRTVYLSAQPLSLVSFDIESTSRLSMCYHHQANGVRYPLRRTAIAPRVPSGGCHHRGVISNFFTEVRILSSVLGDGVRSRLSERLREEMGVVYVLQSFYWWLYRSIIRSPRSSSGLIAWRQ